MALTALPTLTLWTPLQLIYFKVPKPFHTLNKVVFNYRQTPFLFKGCYLFSSSQAPPKRAMAALLITPIITATYSYKDCI